MSDPLALPAPEPPAEPPPAERRVRPDLLPWLTTGGFLILALALFWVWRHPVVDA